VSAARILIVMKPNFALNLSHEGIVLLHRSPHGAWTEVGDVSLNDANFAESLSFLRSTAVGLEGKGFGTKLIIPASQVLYTIVDAPGPSDAARKSQITAALEDQTPYPVADLVFDWRNVDGRVEVAVIATETLDEAEEFAVDHRFNPLCFTSHSQEDGDAWEPFFGPTDYAIAVLGPDVVVRDAPDAAPAEAETHSDARLTDVEPEPDIGAPFVSRRPVPATDKITSPDPTPKLRASPRFNLGDGVDGTSEAPQTADAAQDKPQSPVVNPPEETHATPPNTRSQKQAVADRLRLTGAALKTTAARLRAALTRRKTAKPVKSLEEAITTPSEIATPPKAFAAFLGLSRTARLVIGTGVAVLLVGAVLAALLWTGVPLPLTRQEPATTDAAFPVTQGPPTIDQHARPRPDNLDITHAPTPPSPETLARTRPEPRNANEGGFDPDLGRPDTVDPVTELTQQELDDIRSAGLAPPSLEESSEGQEADSTTTELTPAQISQLYADSGILQALTGLRPTDAKPERDDIFVSQVDLALESDDANALPDFSTGPQDDRPAARLSPVPPDTTFDFDPRGLVIATADGALNPDGLLIFKGRPAVAPPDKPAREALVPPDPLADAKPRARPEDLKTGEDAIFVQGRLTLSQLRAKRPKQRPKSEQTLQDTSGGAATELAVNASIQPGQRPGDFAEKVEKIKTQLAALTPSDTPDTNAGPIIPTRASVAKLATDKNVLNRSKLNLIGVYGTTSKRRALLRLPSGRFVKVEIGDRIDGGRVAAIDENSLRYVKSGRNRLLKIPQ